MRTPPRILPAVAALLVGACAAPQRPTSADGQALYRSRCASCHRPYEPGDRTRADWIAQVDRMAPRAHLAGAAREAVLGYLVEHAKDAAQGAAR